MVTKESTHQLKQYFRQVVFILPLKTRNQCMTPISLYREVIDKPAHAQRVLGHGSSAVEIPRFWPLPIRMIAFCLTLTESCCRSCLTESPMIGCSGWQEKSQSPLWAFQSHRDAPPWSKTVCLSDAIFSLPNMVILVLQLSSCDKQRLIIYYLRRHPLDLCCNPQQLHLLHKQPLFRFTRKRFYNESHCYSSLSPAQHCCCFAWPRLPEDKACVYDHPA